MESDKRIIRVALVDDDDNIRVHLGKYLRLMPDMEIVAMAASGEDALKTLPVAKPDVIIMDIYIPGLDGIVLTRRIRGILPEVRVIGFSGYASVLFLRAMMAAKAAGFISKPVPFEKIAEGIRTVMQGRRVFSPDIRDLIYEDYAASFDAAQDSTRLYLTDREWEVLWRVSEGWTSRRIADAMTVAPKTVEWHRQNLMDKTNRHCMAELIKFAMQHKLLPEAREGADRLDPADS